MLEVEHRFYSGMMKEDDAIHKIEQMLDSKCLKDPSYDKLKAKMYYMCANWLKDK